MPMDSSQKQTNSPTQNSAQPIALLAVLPGFIYDVWIRVTAKGDFFAMRKPVFATIISRKSTISQLRLVVKVTYTTVSYSNRYETSLLSAQREVAGDSKEKQGRGSSGGNDSGPRQSQGGATASEDRGGTRSCC